MIFVLNNNLEIDSLDLLNTLIIKKSCKVCNYNYNCNKSICNKEFVFVGIYFIKNIYESDLIPDLKPGQLYKYKNTSNIFIVYFNENMQQLAMKKFTENQSDMDILAINMIEWDLIEFVGIYKEEA
ncbi:MAG: hypothetical protein ACFFDH_00380 [Promethearchaeota archaeon]